MKVNSAEELLAMQLFSTYIKKSMGDGPMFELVLEALMNSSEASVLDVFKSTSNRSTANLEGLPLNNLDYNGNAKAYVYNGLVNNSGSISNERSYINSVVEKYAQRYDIESKLIHAIIKQESDYDKNATSYAGAMGLMQLMPSTCSEHGVTKPYDIEENIRGGVAHIKNYLRRYNNDLEMALMAYNAGPGTLQRRGVTKSSEIYKAPKETQNYVKKVMDYYKS